MNGETLPGFDDFWLAYPRRVRVAISVRPRVSRSPPHHLAWRRDDHHQERPVAEMGTDQLEGDN